MARRAQPVLMSGTHKVELRVGGACGIHRSHHRIEDTLLVDV